MEHKQYVGLSAFRNAEFLKERFNLSDPAEHGKADEQADRALCSYAFDAMREKLEQKRSEGRGGWWNEDACDILVLRNLLLEHVHKGDMVDVMNFAAMIYTREAMAEMADV